VGVSVFKLVFLRRNRVCVGYLQFALNRTWNVYVCLCGNALKQASEIVLTFVRIRVRLLINTGFVVKGNEMKLKTGIVVCLLMIFSFGSAALGQNDNRRRDRRDEQNRMVRNEGQNNRGNKHWRRHHRRRHRHNNNR
jgi:hypothetical protein